MSHEVVPGQFGEFRLDVKPRQIPADRCVDVEVLLFLKLKQRDRGKGLGYRADGEAAVGSHGDMGLQIRIAEYNNLLQILSIGDADDHARIAQFFEGRFDRLGGLRELALDIRHRRTRKQ
jgi:hypothetical protein